MHSHRFHSIPFTVAIEDEMLLRAFVKQQLNGLPPITDDLPSMAAQAFSIPTCTRKDNGLCDMLVNQDVQIEEDPAGLFSIKITVTVVDPNALWLAAKAEYLKQYGQPLDHVLSTDEQIYQVMMGANLAATHMSKGLKVWPHESIDSQEDVKFVWRYPSGEEYSLPAFVDQISGDINVLGHVFTNADDVGVEHFIETAGESFHAAPSGMYESPSESGNRLVWYRSWGLLDNEIKPFQEDRVQALEYRAESELTEVSR